MLLPFDCIKDEEAFQDAMARCGNALTTAAPFLYGLIKEGQTTTLDISFRFNPDEVVSVDFKVNKVVR